MPFIHLTTFIAAPAERVFDLSRNINFHAASMKDFNEKAVAGKIEGLIELNDTVSWKARHFFKERFLKSKITSMNFPYSFIDEQEEGDFKKMRHEHYFKKIENGTIMIDQFYYEPPYGSVGRIFSALFLTRYMKNLLEQRNLKIKETAEGDQWKHYLEK
jgi:ligand-binding SRPBCC domain-containing protein